MIRILLADDYTIIRKGVRQILTQAYPAIEIEEIEHQPGRDWGKLKIKVRLINQRDEVVLEGRHLYRMRSRAGMTTRRGA